jgi:Carboxypeptidase regulatory-like domain/TonB-dependent Receptor Plug Domain
MKISNRCGLILALTFAGNIFAQTGEVSGLIKDSSGASVPKALVRIQNTDSGIKSETVSNQDGFYALPFLKVGPYEITVEAKGFKIINQTGIRITVGAGERIDFNMEVGQPTESVTVTAEPGPTESPAVATVVDRQLVENLPLNGRSFQSLVELTPGIVLTPTNVTESGQFSVNGQRANANYFMIDGVSANFGVNGSATLYESAGGTLPAYSALGGTNNLVSVDAVQEFRIQTST